MHEIKTLQTMCLIAITFNWVSIQYGFFGHFTCKISHFTFRNISFLVVNHISDFIIGQYWNHICFVWVHCRDVWQVSVDPVCITITLAFLCGAADTRRPKALYPLSVRPLPLPPRWHYKPWWQKRWRLNHWFHLTSLMIIVARYEAGNTIKVWW